jgi:lambda family phage minor tail protein L
MRTVTQDFITRKNASENKPAHLWIIEEGPLGLSVLRYAEYPTNLVFDGETYYAAPIQSGAITENMAQQVDQTTISIGSVDQAITAYLESVDGLRGCKITRRTIFVDLLNDPTSFTDDIFWIASVALTNKAATFTLKSKLDLFDLELPLRRFYRLTCQSRFKGVECAYAGSTTTCGHTLDECNTRLNRTRFGGFPGTGSAIRRIYV